MEIRNGCIAYSDALTFHPDDMVKGFRGIVASKFNITPTTAPARLSILAQVRREVFRVVKYLDQWRKCCFLLRRTG